MTKEYVLDTNVILNDYLSIFKFKQNNVVIPMTVVEELDHFKKELTELGRNARQFSKAMDILRERGSLAAGVTLDNGGVLRVVQCGVEAKATLPSDMDLAVPDNRILAVTLWLSKTKNSEVILVTQDINMRIKADTLGVTAEAFKSDVVVTEDFYSGIVDSKEEILYPNQFVRNFDSKGQLIGIERYDKGKAEFVPLREDLEAWGLSPVNEEQRCLMDLLLNDDIKLVTVSGIAGCGKTLVALAAALRQVTDDFIYKKVLVARPVIPMGKDIGYLPGDISEKLSPYMQPIHDNVEFLMTGQVAPKSKKILPTTKKLSKAEREALLVDEEKEGGYLKSHMELEAAGIMEVEPLMFIRGRSIPNVIMLCDESQNLSKHEIKTIVTRAGKNTKLIFTGDPDQIDNPYVDASSNGLSYLIEKFKDEPIAGHITLVQGERSELAEIAARLL